MTQKKLVYETTTGVISAVADSGGGAFPPQQIAAGDTYEVAVNTQVVIRQRGIRVDGKLRIDGVLSTT